MDIDLLTEVLQKAVTIDLFPGHMEDPSLICTSFSDALSLAGVSNHIYSDLMELYPKFGKSIIIDVLKDKITLTIPDKLNNPLISVKNLSFNNNELKTFTDHVNSSKPGKYELIIGAWLMGYHNTLRSPQSKLFFDSCIINKLDK